MSTHNATRATTTAIFVELRYRGDLYLTSAVAVS